MNSLYNENHILGRLFRKFMDLFPQATKPTKKLLALFLIGQVPELHMSCAWLENSELRNCPVEEALFYPLKL